MGGGLSGPNLVRSANGRLLSAGPPGADGKPGGPGPAGPAGSSVLSPLRKGATYAAVTGDSPLLYANTAGGAWTFTMPPNPQDGQIQIITDEGVISGSLAGTFGAANLTVNLTGSQSIVRPWPSAGVVDVTATLAVNLDSWAWRWSAAVSCWLPTGA